MSIIRANNRSLRNVTALPFGTGGLALLQRTVVSTSTASVAFNSTYINSTYDDYVFRMNDVIPVSDGAYPQCTPFWLISIWVVF